MVIVLGETVHILAENKTKQLPSPNSQHCLCNFLLLVELVGGCVCRCLTRLRLRFPDKQNSQATSSALRFPPTAVGCSAPGLGRSLNPNVARTHLQCRTT